MTDSRTILVAEDEPEVRHYLRMALRCQGFGVECAEDGEEALHYLCRGERPVSLVLLDLMMPRKDGLETLREMRRLDQNLPIIILSGVSAPLKVLEALKSGATDFLGKPVSHEDLGRAIGRALRTEAAVKGAPPDPATPTGGEDITFCGNPQMKKIQTALEQIAAWDVPVLFQGASGVGKEVLARRLHALSPRAGKPLLKLNCAAMPSELLESELFGYEKGAFTGAFKNKPGKFEIADGGTILLDEIGDMDCRLQAKLLHVLQDNEFQRLGGKDTVRVNVRVLAATHRDLEKAMREGHFREDLYYRLNVINIHVPALEQRKDEILPLARFFLRKHGAPQIAPPDLTPDLQQALLSHDWPGNIRELENLMRKFLVFRDPEALAGELREKSRLKLKMALSQPAGRAGATTWETPSAAPSEAEEILQALEANHWNRRQAAAALRMDYRGFLYRIRKLGIDKVQPFPGSAAVVPQETAAPAWDQVTSSQRQAEAEAILAALRSTLWNRRQAAALLGMDYKALLYRMKKLAIGGPEWASDPPMKQFRAARE